jgi:hypothetical protein
MRTLPHRAFLPGSVDFEHTYRLPGARMAKKTTTQLVDDIDGTILGEDGTTVSFSVDGTSYEIDLGAEHADELRGRAQRGARLAPRQRTQGRRAWADLRGADGPIPGPLTCRAPACWCGY